MEEAFYMNAIPAEPTPTMTWDQEPPSIKVLNLPKLFPLAGKWWTILVDPDKGGAEFNFAHCVMTIGTRDGVQQAWENFIHEMIEISMCAAGMRYTSVNDYEPIFVGEHQLITVVCNYLSAALMALMQQWDPTFPAVFIAPPPDPIIHPKGDIVHADPLPTGDAFMPDTTSAP